MKTKDVALRRTGLLLLLFSAALVGCGGGRGGSSKHGTRSTAKNGREAP